MLEKMKKNRWIWVCLLLFLLFAAVTAGMMGLLGTPGLAGGINFSPTMTNGTEIEPDTQFAITGAESQDEAALRAKLRLLDAAGLDLGYGLEPDPAVPGKWLLTPAKTLDPGSGATLVVGGIPHPFVVAKTLLILSTSPQGGSADTPVGSGIQLRFNAIGVGSGALQTALTIDPPLEFYLGGSSELDKEYVIYPRDSLQYDTTYTVTVDTSLQSLGGFQLRENYTFSFTTVSQLAERMAGMFTLRNTEAAYNTLTDEAPMFQAYFDQSVLVNGQAPAVEVNLYQYPNADIYKKELSQQYAAAQGYRGSNGFTGPAIDAKKLTPYSTFTAQPVPLSSGEDNDRGAQMILFPEPLPEGWYLAEFLYLSPELGPDGKPYPVRRQSLVQSSDLAAFFLHANEDLVLWLNDASTGQPIEGATFQMEGDLTTQLVTKADGTAQISEPRLLPEREGDKGVFTITWDGHTFVDARRLSASDSFEQPNQRYIGDLFTDKPLYQTTDTIRVWGYLRPRRPETPMPEKITLSMEGIEPRTVVPDDKGFFTDVIEISQMGGDSWPSLLLHADGNQLAYEGLRVSDFVKPVYTTVMAPEQPVYLLSDKSVTPAVSGQVTLFDGTPVPDFVGTVKEQWGSTLLFTPDTITTDKDGLFRNTVEVVLPPDESYNYSYVRSYPYALQSDGAEEENYMASGYLYAIHRDLLLEGKVELQSGKPAVTITTNRVDISRIKTVEDLDRDNGALLRGPAVSVPVTAQIRKNTVVKVQTGTTYDYVNRVSVPNYRYEDTEEIVATYNLQTVNGVVTLTDLPQRDPDASYTLLLSAPDSAGQRTEASVAIFNYNRPFQDDLYRYGLDPAAPDRAKNDPWSQWGSFGDGENTVFQLCNSDRPVEQMQGRILSATIQNKIENVTVTDKDTVILPFSENLLPNYTLSGAYFDGKHIFALDHTSMSFDSMQRELDIQLDTGKTVYAPGDKVELTATVTEKKTGKPAQNAELVVAVVDEAIFAIQEQRINLLENLYDWVYFPVLNKYTSYNSPIYNNAGEKGGGGNDVPVRSKFPDTVLFSRAKTDGGGNAALSFTLPDNITSWRLTALSLTDNNWAGDTKTNITATMDYYVTPMVNREILAGDSFTLGLRSAGVSVTTTDPVRYTVLTEGPNGYSQTAEVTAQGIREYGWATFDDLAVGDYTVTVQGSCKTFSDAVKLPFQVLPSGVELSKVKTVDLANGLAVESLRYPVRVNAYEKEYEVYNRVLENLNRISTGSRADMRIARKQIELLEEAAGGDPPAEGEYISDLNWGYEPISLFPYTEPDLALQAKAFLAAPNIFITNRAQYRFEAGATPTEPYDLANIPSFYIIQALEGNYLPGTEIKADYSYLDQLDLALAAAIAGDTTLADRKYQELVTPNLKSWTGLGLPEQGMMSIPGTDGLSEQDCTAAASRLASFLGKPEADSLVLYLINRENKYDTSIMEQLLYLRCKDQQVGQNKGQISFTLDGKTETMSLEKAMLSFSLTQKQLAEFTPKVLSGQVYADLYYTAPVTEADPAQNKIPVTKTIEPAEGFTDFTPGALVKVTITPDLSGFAPNTGEVTVIVDDYLPSGMKFESYEPPVVPEGSKTPVFYLATRQNQRLRFSAQAENGTPKPIVYYARCATPGRYVMESCFASSGAGAQWGSSQSGLLTIQP